MSNDDGHAKVNDLLKSNHISMVTTVDGDGHFTSRPMAHQQVEDSSELWFFTDADSTLTKDIQARPHVSVTVSSNDAWVSLDGNAKVVHDLAKAKELWNPVVSAWMPQGPEDPSVVLVKVDPHHGEYWDTPGSKVASALSFVKAKVTGKPFEGGENQKVDL